MSVKTHEQEWESLVSCGWSKEEEFFNGQPVVTLTREGGKMVFDLEGKHIKSYVVTSKVEEALRTPSEEDGRIYLDPWCLLPWYFPHEGYCVTNPSKMGAKYYRHWEERVSKYLKSEGLEQVGNWYSEDSDSFGPLVRACKFQLPNSGFLRIGYHEKLAIPAGQVITLVYG